MTTKIAAKRSRAWTLIEVLVVVLTVMVLFVLFLPSIVPHGGHKSLRIECVNNLKQVGLAFRIWGGDHQDRFPMQVWTNETSGLKHMSGSDVFRMFETMSNELNSPKILICPGESDKARRAATVFSPNVAGIPGAVPFNGNRNVSYFLGVDSTPTNATMLLAGDRNITNGFALNNGLLELKTNQSIGWTKDMHHFAGNILLSDGSAQMVTSQGLRDLLKNTGVETTRLAMP